MRAAGRRLKAVLATGQRASSKARAPPAAPPAAPPVARAELAELRELKKRLVDLFRASCHRAESTKEHYKALAPEAPHCGATKKQFAPDASYGLHYNPEHAYNALFEYYDEHRAALDPLLPAAAAYLVHGDTKYKVPKNEVVNGKETTKNIIVKRWGVVYALIVEYRKTHTEATAEQWVDHFLKEKLDMR